MVVRMSCFACATPTMQSATITYSRDKSGSSEATFQIVPIQKLARATDGFFQVAFDVSVNGVEYDHIVVGLYAQGPVIAASNGSSLAQNVSAPPPPAQPQSDDVLSARPDGSRDADLELDFAKSGSDLLVGVNPVDPKLKAWLSDNNITFSGYQRFTIGTPDVETITRKGYISLRAILEPRSELWKYASQTGQASSPILPSMAGLALSDKDYKAVLKTLYTTGAALYATLFSDAKEDTLKKVMFYVDTFRSDHPLRIRIYTDENIQIPWQLLHPPGNIMSDKFWGFRYELSIVPSFYAKGRLEGPLEYSPADRIVFASYRDKVGDPVDAEVSRYAEEFGRHLKESIKNGSVFSPVNTRTDLLDKLLTLRKEVWFIAAYAHASSGVTRTKGEGDTSIVGDDKMGRDCCLLPVKR